MTRSGRWAGTALLVPLLAAGCGAAAPHATAATTAGGTPGPAEVRVVAVGDSITEMDSPDFDAGDVDQSSWAWWAAGNGVDVLGGWAHSGATTADALAEVQPMQADAVVVMLGNNDIDWTVPTRTVLDHLVAIADVVGVPRVVLSAVAPEDGLGPEVADLNDALAGLAARQGWQFVDPMTDVRDQDGDYRAGTTLDGVHPTEEASARIGVALHEAVLDPDDVSVPAPSPVPGPATDRPDDAADVGPPEQTA
ncbi:Lysophospholipase L1 [Klenkia marina]|uniref:Lysophospholipase L1 n=1 Tax=Klenkia marina TaxID=1960309 RepID=A0A1G4YUG8_9ACTN|nr:SGNH/GDSL hydrolase family protein [Klenkia marina]SCX57094.1 Lysophospholipase L1 [Klenkia marina]